jgi:hypothetical protein
MHTAQGRTMRAGCRRKAVALRLRIRRNIGRSVDRSKIMSTSTHPSTRRKGGRPARQRHAHASATKSHTKKRANGSTNRWSQHVNETSDAMDISAGVFKTGNAEEIAQSLKQSSLRSRRRKGTPFQSAMSMLNFYINRAGKNLPRTRRDTLTKAKGKLREAFGRKP